MQMMARSSDEGRLPGLGWFDARRQALRRETCSPGPRTCRTWAGTTSRRARASGLLAGLDDDARFYFLHSYHFAPNDEKPTRWRPPIYGGRFACAVQRDNVHGVQFHPEKSHGWGVQLLKNFAEPLKGTMLRPRIIPCLLVHKGGLVKTVGFDKPKYVGDPLNAVRIFNEKEVDELMVLDIDATVADGASPTTS